MNIKNVIKNRLNVVAGKLSEGYVQFAKLHNGTNKKESRNVKIIASLTSYSARLKTIHLTIKSILLQTKKADRVILWLGNDVSKEELTPELKSLCKYGLEIRFVDDNLMPHKKYFYAMQEFPNDIVITFDDDVYYSPFTISSLYKTFVKNPFCVCARRTHRILFSPSGEVLPYLQWEFNATHERNPSFRLFATGIGGILYPPNAINPIAFDAGKIKQECFFADDIWLKTMEVLNETKVVWVRCLVIVPPDVEKNADVGLTATNVYNNKNDEYITELNNRYRILDKIRGEESE